MTAFKYLSQIQQISAEIQSLIEEVNKIESSLTSGTSVITGMPTGNGNNDKFEILISKAIDMRDEIADKISMLIDKKNLILKQIMSLKYPYNRILKLRFFDFMTLEKIAVEMNYTYRHVERLKDVAYREFEEKFLKKNF